jgi:hypothetical protein
MNTYKYKEISKEEALKLKLLDKLYLKRYGTGRYDEYKCVSQQHGETIYFATYMGYNMSFFLSNSLKQDEFFNTFSLYIKIPTYSAIEIMQKIESGELKDDDILIDKNGTEDSIYDILEQSIMALKDYEPYQIKEKKPVKMYYGDEIIKMIRDSKFKHNDRLLGYLSNGEKVGEFVIFKNDNATTNIKEVGSYEDDVDSWDLINMKFSIKE